MITEKYTSGLISQSFWFIETKKILSLIREGKTKSEIEEICINENIFGVTKEYRAKRILGYIWRRIKRMDDELIEIFHSSNLETQKLIILIAILFGDRLFFEFIYDVYREKIILGERCVSIADLNVFFKKKEDEYEEIAKWSEGTKKRLRAVYTNYMIDANLIAEIDNKKIITPPIIDMSLVRYLKLSNNGVIIKAITGVN